MPKINRMTCSMCGNSKSIEWLVKVRPEEEPCNCSTIIKMGESGIVELKSNLSTYVKIYREEYKRSKRGRR